MRFSCNRVFHFQTLACIACLLWRAWRSKSKFNNFLNKGIIRPSTLPCGSPNVLVPKKDGTWCMCGFSCTEQNRSKESLSTPKN